MTHSTKKQDSVEQLIADIKKALLVTGRGAAEPSTARRKLRTFTEAGGYRQASAGFLRALQARMGQAGIYSDQPLTDPGLRQDDWILLSTSPLPADVLFFPKEKDLQGFVEACLGNGPLRNLEPFREKGSQVAPEYCLPSGRRIDLLCQERGKSGPGALVATELKREHEKGTIEQMTDYLRDLKLLFPGRPVRGIIISGREDHVPVARLKELKEYQAEWLCYSVVFTKVASNT